MINNVTVIIRAVDERTIEACRTIVLQEVCSESVFVIKEKPFSQAVKTTFEIGIQQEKKWTLAVDADLLLIPGSVSIMIENAEEYASDLYMYQGRILDKFRGGIKQGGPHLYLTKNLVETQQFYGKMENELRPETFINKNMELLGYKVISERKLFALHDFYQFYKDIYRKSYFHGIKHHKWKSFLPIWMEKSDLDPDFIIAVRGFVDGYFSIDKIYPSVDYLNIFYKEQISPAYRLIEKNDFGIPVDADFKDTLFKYNITITPQLNYNKNSNKKDKRTYKELLKRLFKLIRR